MSWKLNGVVLQDNNDRCTRHHDVCLLVIDEVKLEQHTGDYKCTATNLKGSDEKSVNVQVQGIGLTSFSFLSENL